MKKKYDDYALLSAYLDGELNDDEKDYIEKKLSTSVVLQNKLEELKNIKAAIMESKQILQENIYFEQKVMSAILEEKNNSLMRIKFIPVFSLITALIAIVILSINLNFFNINFNPSNKDHSEYISSLKPLFNPSEISKEELFNFALYEEIPLNKNENQIIKISYDESGKEYFEIKVSENKIKNNNLSSFLSKLNLNQKDITKIDSLFNKYAIQLSKNILVGKNNSLAINPSVWNLRKAMLSDFIMLTRQLSPYNFDKLAQSCNLKIPNEALLWGENFDSFQTEKYIVFTNDSIFTSELSLSLNNPSDNNSENQENTDSESNFSGLNFDNVVKTDKKVRIIKSPKYIQVQVEQFEIPEIQISEFDSFLKLIERSIQEKSNLNIVNQKNFNRPRENQKKASIIFQQYGLSLDSILEIQNRTVKNSQNKISDINKTEPKDSKTKIEAEDFNRNIDEEIKTQLEKIREEIENFKKQFNNFINEDTLKSKKDIVPLTNDVIEL